MEFDLPKGVRRAGEGDWRLLAEITATAFRDDPVNNWLFGNPRAIRFVFRVLARSIYSKHGICHLVDDKGAAMWMDYTDANVQADLGLMAQLQLTAGLMLHGDRGSVKRTMKAADIMAAHHPKQPHLYLFTIGTVPSARGTGLGKALLAPVLAACDANGTACYLENSNPANQSYYTWHGFKTLEIFACGEGGPPLEAMWRDPR